MFSDKEKLWKYFFRSEYKPDVKIDFQGIKELIAKKKEEYMRWYIDNYPDEDVDPEELCDYFIKDSQANGSITFLESIDPKYKTSLVNMLS